ncbi:TonB-dependent receptor [Ekhidna sp.]|uniref:TonB-dependent receptor n=1 Tax=Ekhidna sp. TaxID=2608089 RepID=UPI00329953C0
MKKFLLLIAVMPCLLFAQENYTINGYVKDAANGEALIGATVLITELGTGNITNVYGFYSITLPAGDYTVEYRYLGFVTQRESVSLSKNNRIDIELSEEQTTLQEVVVTARPEDENVTSTEMSVAELDIKTISKLPVFAGEIDIIKSIQLLPGVSSVGEGASGFNVRGGSVGQNLILLDEAPVYQSSHLFGFFSVFNPDAVKDVKLYKGGIPSRYGGRLSSILDVRMKEGNSKDLDVSGGIGTIFSRLTVEGPIKKDKASFIVAGRRSYADVPIRLLTDFLNDGAALYFYDLTAKANYNIDDKNKVFVSGYFGRDVFKFDALQGFNWGNQTASVRWNHLFNDRFFSNFTAFYSNYDYAFEVGNTDDDQFDWSSKVQTINFKPQFSYFLNQKNELTFGGELLYYTFFPADAVGFSSGNRIDLSLEKKNALETSLYVSNNQKVTKDLSIEYGLRYSSFNHLGPGNKYVFGDTLAGLRKPVSSTTRIGNNKSLAFHQNFEPRLSVRYQLSSSSSIKMSYNRMNQYIHLISNTVAATPIDVWQPSTNNIQPQQGDQVALGYFKNFKNNAYETSAEVYYKKTKNQVDYIDGADLFINDLLEADVLSGDGRAYGLEIYAKKNEGDLTGWVSYTLARSELKIDGINYGLNSPDRAGRWYPTRFDQTHNLKVVGNYKLKERKNLSATFSYISGTPTTYATDRILVAGQVIPINNGSRNNFRIPDYHRLDVSYTIDYNWVTKKGRERSSSLVLSVYNLYNRKNAFAVNFTQDEDRIDYSQLNNINVPNQPVTTSAFETSILFFVLPSVTYNFKF